VERILRSRLCASTPAQYGYLAGLCGSKDWLDKHRKLTEERMNFCLKRINEIDGLSCESPKGAFYLFVKLTNPEHQRNDKKWVLDLLHQEHVLVVHGSGFSPEFGAGHFRMVCLPPIPVLEEAFRRIERFLSS